MARKQVRDMGIRAAVVEGQFYPGGAESCLEEIQECLASRPLDARLPAKIVAGIVPHAGWAYSGALAAMVFAAVRKQRPEVSTFVLFGTAHRYLGSLPAVDDSSAWETPLGTVDVDAALRDALLAKKAVVTDTRAHRYEHSIEVQVPFVQHLFPEAKIVPIIVPPAETALSLGRTVGELIAAADRPIVCIGSTDLTHYGPDYNFTPMGRGTEGVQWAAGVNDRQFIDLAVAMEPERLLAEAKEKGNACGPGAAAAAIAAAGALGASKGQLLAYTNSSEVMRAAHGPGSPDSVGYAAIVF